ncbi:hypothetical protein NLG97_g5298 [Lecanicillium saksenae]|uniref:Uncharacterized protein n=1 Tax=Lecanicillium saksenae TaxID=468837 RepID=A0ACC1QUQ9_9HYPO|nr:hypothetical protein NLG97_g5298 [Lecanicillium saksenae]
MHPTAVAAMEGKTDDGVPFRARPNHVHRTWARTFASMPELYIQPQTIEEVEKVVNLARLCRRRIVTTGCGHSPSNMTCTSSWMGIVVMDSGIRLFALGEELERHGLAMPNLGSINEQSIAGAISTGTHGSSAAHGLMSEDILSLKITLASGKTEFCSANVNPDLFRAALLSLGSLGIITEVTLRAVPAFTLRWQQTIDSDRKMLDSWNGELWKQTEFVRVWWFPYTRRAVVWKAEKTDEPHHDPPVSYYDGPLGYYVYHNLLYAAQFVPRILPWVEWFVFGMQYGFANGSTAGAVQPSRKALLMNCLYSQFVNEWAIPLSKGPEALRRLSSWINHLTPDDPDYIPHNIPFSADGLYVHAPVEVRVSDSSLASQVRPFLDPTVEDGPTLYLNATLYRPYWRDPPCRERYYEAFEWLMKDMGGRPHWAKNFDTRQADVQAFYGDNLKQFRRVRDEADPEGMFVGAWHREKILLSLLLSKSDYSIIEPALRRLDNLLILRTFVSGGYSFSDVDRESWLAIRHNTLALKVMRQPKTFQNVMRWYYYIKETQPQLDIDQRCAGGSGKKQAGDRYKMKLHDAYKGVVTRFPPEPSGYLHIGHAKAAFLNDYFAHDAFPGSLILRFDDTNPTKERQDDYFGQLYELAKELISCGKAYADDTDVEIQKFDRRDRLPSVRRDRPADESLAIFDEMRRGTDWGKKHCIRARIQYDNSNGSQRDPIIYRFPSWDIIHGQQPHHRSGWAWNIYPTYDFACPLVDSIDGVTHALRTTEYADRNAQYDWFLKALNMRHNVFVEEKTFPSCRVWASGGWDDPRMPTVRGIVRRGLTVGVLREFMLKQGPSRNVVSMDWSVLWAMNKKAIDPIARRHAAVEDQHAVLVTVEGAKQHAWRESRPMHPKNSALGTKMITFSSKVWIEQVDAASLTDGDEITLMHWGNAIIRGIVKDGDTIKSISVALNLEGDVSKTKKLHWVASEDSMQAELWEFGDLLTKDSLAKTDKLDDFLNPVTSFMVTAKVGQQLADVEPGSFVQLERKGYYRVDKVTGKGKSRVTVLFKVPTGSQA